MNVASNYSCIRTNCICTFEASSFKTSLIVSVALIIIGSLAMTPILPMGIGGIVCLSSGLALFVLASVVRLYKMRSEEDDIYRVDACDLGLTSEYTLSRSWDTYWYDFKSSEFAVGLRQFFYIKGHEDSPPQTQSNSTPSSNNIRQSNDPRKHPERNFSYYKRFGQKQRDALGIGRLGFTDI